MVRAKDTHLFAAVEEFTKRELREKPNLGDFTKVWTAVALDADGQIEKVLGVSGIRQVVDIALFRSIDSGATLKLAQRINDHLADAGLLHAEIMLYVDGSEVAEQRCDGYDGALQVWNARPAHRQLIVVR